MKKLHLIFEHAVFVQANSRVGGLTCNVFKKWVDCNSLHEFAMTFKRLNFSELILCNAPYNRSAIKRARN